MPIRPSAGPARTSSRVRPSRRWESKSKSASALLSWWSPPAVRAWATMNDSVDAIAGLRGMPLTARCGRGAVSGQQGVAGMIGALGDPGTDACADPRTSTT